MMDNLYGSMVFIQKKYTIKILQDRKLLDILANEEYLLEDKKCSRVIIPFKSNELQHNVDYGTAFNWQIFPLHYLFELLKVSTARVTVEWTISRIKRFACLKQQ